MYGVLCMVYCVSCLVYRVWWSDVAFVGRVVFMALAAFLPQHCSVLFCMQRGREKEAGGLVLESGVHEVRYLGK